MKATAGNGQVTLTWTAPKVAGGKESYAVKGLAPGTHHFAVKSRDEGPNQSPISNVVKVEVK